MRYNACKCLKKKAYKMNDLTQARKEIDSINKQMAELFKKRMELSVQVAKYKMENNIPIYDKDRETAILQQMAELAGAELAEYTQELFITLFSLSKAYQEKLMGQENGK